MQVVPLHIPRAAHPPNLVSPLDLLVSACTDSPERLCEEAKGLVPRIRERTREALEQELGDRVRASADFREGVAAFREKRRPRYE